MEEITFGIKALQKHSTEVSCFSAQGKTGAKDIQEASDAKIKQIKQHAASLRAVIDRKEAASIHVRRIPQPGTLTSEEERNRVVYADRLAPPILQACEDTCKQRLEALQKDITIFDNTIPRLKEMIEVFVSPRGKSAYAFW